MTRTKTYAEAISLLNTCQSNAAAIEAIRKSGGRLNEHGIAEMNDYLRRIGYKPDDLNKLNVVHITGTKGKGSTSAFTERILRSHIPGGKIGLYTSPHLCAVRERIRINGEPISEELFAKYFFEVWERLETDSKPLTPQTPQFPIYFRLLTLLAFHTFLSLDVTATVLEVGIGGTYDSTNIVPKPIVTGITSLGLDHTAVLGNTIEEIATNKAGIYKKDVPALSVEQEQAGDVLKSIAEKNGAPFEVVPTIPETRLGLPGAHQRINASLAVAMSQKFLKSQSYPFAPSPSPNEIPPSFVEPLASTRWPGRCQLVRQGKTTWLLDGAHTTESLRSCGEWAWAEDRKPDVLIFNCSGGRAAESLLGELLATGARTKGVSREELGKTFDSVVFCTNVTYTDGHFKSDLDAKAIDPNDLSQLATQRALRDAWLKLNPSFRPERAHAVASIQHAVDIVRGLGEKTVLVAGSLHLVGGVMEVAGLQDALSME
ncbi:folylpolyglutamate synthase [Kwoniella heveanensis CBS 569]|uniref:Folylpolyglutamate synthase n=1 Tax=Kwoniella heveanensis BCC8398 TaxID=1296120 RepID=A0A1B9GJF9_9TREE|nr:folylpolyglutamate synthase [Kwoniella heveanensis BCC8398]OCF38348.1 folylpolyglutamate synthase [Kwoniella heveanensis CBS 569]